MNRKSDPVNLPSDNPEHEQRIAAIRERAQRHAQRSARLFAPPPEPEGCDLPVPSLLAVACSVALANQAQAQATQVSNDYELRQALGNATDIVLTQDISLGSEQSFYHSELNIVGQNHTVELNNKRALWNGGNARNIGDISDVTFKNGRHSYGIGSNGGVIDLYGVGKITGDIVNSHFENSHVNALGGAIYTNSIDGSIRNSSFTGNSSGNLNALGSGGAIHVKEDIHGDIEETVFKNNTAKYAGGAIRTVGGIKGTIRGSHFIDNKSTTSHGGALYISGDIEGGIEGSTFTGNTAKLNGGVIDITTLTGGIRDSHFTNNHAGFGGSGDTVSGHGGAVWVYGGAGYYLERISGGSFTNNSAERSGGAVSVTNEIRNGIHGVTFSGNSSKTSSGGAVALGAVGSGFTGAGVLNGGIQDSTFKNNEALQGSGGAIYASTINGGITNNTTFEGNTSLTGGAIFLSNGTHGLLTGGIDNSKFIGNTATDTGGGAIHLHNGTLQGGIKNGTEFRDNTAHGHGGALWLNAFQDGISDSNFTGNKALTGAGGAISTGTFDGGIRGSVFEKNSAQISGGAIHIYGALKGGITNNSIFKENSAHTGGGGAIAAIGAINGGINNSQFEGNTSGSNGGAIFVTEGGGSNSILDGGINNSKFIGNTANNHGGAIVLSTGTLKGGVNGTEFRDNTAINGNGGAFYITYLEGGVSDSIFTGNKSLGVNGIGGAIAPTHKLSGDINKSIFTDNSAKVSGGAIWTSTLDGNINGSTFTDNTASDEFGGAIRATEVITGGINNSTFKKNSAGDFGGAIAVGHATTTQGTIVGGITGSTFEENTAGNLGGAIRTTHGISGGITGSTFKENSAKNTGGAIATNNINGDIAGTTFDSNKTETTGSGGAVWVGGTGTIDGSIIDSKFTNNISGDGGALRTYILTGDVSNTQFIGNISHNLGGGAIHSNQIHGGIKNGSVFENNVTHGSRGGGAIWTDTINGGISDSTFTGNEALALAAKGGAIHAQMSISGGITNSVFKKNSADYLGGAIAVGDTTQGTLSGGITRSHFEENTANNFGGAIYAEFGISGGIADSTFENNTATKESGGAISAGGLAGINGIINGDISKSTFSNNAAGVRGGAIYTDRGINGNIVDTTFSGNTAQFNGGAIATWAPGSINGNIIGSTFHNNKSVTNSGGAIWAGSVKGDITDSTFSENTANIHGGAIYTTGNIDGNITSTTFSNNTATTEHGGAIYTNSITRNISSTFSDNTAGIHGGALYLRSASGNNTIINSIFSNNTAGDMGGAIFQETGGRLTVNDSRFLGNIAQYSGGAIKTGGELIIKNSGFIGNQGVDNSGINNSATGLGTGLGGAVLIQGQLDIENSVFLGNSAAYRGAAIHHHHDLSGNTHTVRIAGGANKTLFYGNQETDSGRYSSIEFSHTRDNLGDVTIHADKGVEGNSGVLMLDAMQSVNNPATSYTAGSVLNIKKTGDGDWFLGGDSQMVHPGAWMIEQGRLALTNVDYDGTGAQQAHINLEEGSFTLNNGATLEGQGTISAGEINLSGTINPNVWRNTGMLAKDISTGITQADIDGIQTETVKDEFATITLDTQGSGQAIKMDGATYEVGVAWKDNGAGGFDAQSDVLDVKGALDVKNSGVNITRLDFDETWALARIQGGGSEPAAQVIKTTDGITGDFKVQVAGTLAPSSDFLKVRGEQIGNDYEIRLGLAWYSKERDGSRTAVSGNSVMDAHGSFTVDAGGSFTIGGALEKRTDVPNFIDETTEVGGPKGWDGNSLTKRGDGTLILNGDNTYDGLTTIEGGTLVLGDSAANAGARVGGNVQVNGGTTLDGHGRAKGDVIIENGGQFTGFGGADGLLHVKNGGLLAPGNDKDMGTVNAGRLQIDAGGTYRVKTDANGGVDLVNVANDATIYGGKVEVNAKDGNWGKRGTQHTRTIIQAGGPLTGKFDDVTSDLAFLTPSLDYNSGQVILELSRNSTKMEDIADGSTRNRINTGEGLGYLEGSGANPTLINELLGLNKEDALQAFDSLSGEIYPTTSAMLLQSSRQLRTRINTRLTTNTQGTADAPSFNAIRALGVGDTGTSTPVWVSAWGHTGNQGRTPNAARADISGSGILAGIDNTDRPLAGGLHAGVMFGSERTKVEIGDSRASRSEVDSRSVGIYGGSSTGDTQWRGGLIYSDLDVETQRTVTVNSLTERVRTERDGKQMQAFAEISHNLTLSNRTSVAPWLSVAKVWQRLDAAQEGTGAVALDIDKQSASATLASVGGRGQMNLNAGSMPVALYADAGYQYVLDHKNNDSKHHFAGQSQDFAIRGSALNDTFVGAVGVQLGVSHNSALLVEYRTELGSGQQQHVGNLSWQVKF